ncbi:hypothetical protein BV378_26955 [Nostoc sp. RF31YmG]|jgi:hypothetical protein|nr:hypothetical protein BV378_26955 [Nostoc sp. RF31YmG]
MMQLQWTKNVNDQGGGWAYEHIKLHTNFLLNWKTEQRKNAEKPQIKQLIILRQRSRVTHIVKLLDNILYQELTDTEYSICRLVEAVWITDDWHNPPEEKQLFGDKVKFPPNGRVIQLENLTYFKEHPERLKMFHNNVRETLNLEY